ncbi:MAG: beta-galactosidase [Chthoniobacteraceae bacterium]
MRALLFLLVLTLSAAAQIHPSLPEPGTLDGLGVNIHFTEPQPGELEMIRAAGFHWVRMDFTWAATEPEPGRYDFSKYDSLLAALEKAGLRAYFILDYGHPRFGRQDADSIRKPGSQEQEKRVAEDASVPGFMASKFDDFPFTSRAGTQEFREAFAKWAVAAVGHFKGRGIVWELWNEPNIAGFWKPKADVQQYIALAKTVAAALENAGLRGKSRTFPPGMKREAAGECLTGPATSLVDLPFLDACFAAGLLDVFDAISVHPYRHGAPESLRLIFHPLLATLVARFAVCLFIPAHA